MEIYDEREAKIEAARLVTIAVQQGLLGSANPNGYNYPEEAGQKYAKFVGGFIAELAKQLQAL